MFEPPIYPASETLEVFLDGQLVRLPAERLSLSAISTYLERLALEQDRILCGLTVNGRPAKMNYPHRVNFTGAKIEGQTVGLNDMPTRMLDTALLETAKIRSSVAAAVTQVLINDSSAAREIWWQLARQLKEPLLTLSLLPENLYQPAAGCASLRQIRQWQLQQLASLIGAVDEASYASETDALSNAIECRVLPWLDSLYQTILLWRETVRAGVRLEQRETCAAP
jgi:hypothetical protein